MQVWSKRSQESSLLARLDVLSAQQLNSSTYTYGRLWLHVHLGPRSVSTCVSCRGQLPPMFCLYAEISIFQVSCWAPDRISISHEVVSLIDSMSATFQISFTIWVYAVQLNELSVLSVSMLLGSRVLLLFLLSSGGCSVFLKRGF